MKAKFMGAGNKVVATFEIDSKELGDIGVAKLGDEYYTFSGVMEGGGALFERVTFRELFMKDAE